MDGILNIYKESGYTSHDVVAKLRGILHQKKIGHTGTLDPAATGVLPVCIGKATKVCSLLTDADKSYRAVCRLGVETDTLDMEGMVVGKSDYSFVTRKQILETVNSFQGRIKQIPPMYSALKVGGKRLYELAREGKTVERKEREVFISEIKVNDIDLGQGIFTFDVTCSKGTYIRSLCYDIGKKLGTLAAMDNLVRTRVSVFSIEKASTLGEIEKLFNEDTVGFEERLYTVDSLFLDYPRLYIRQEYTKKLENGNSLSWQYFSGMETDRYPVGAKVLVYNANGKFKAIYQNTGTEYKVIKMF